MLHIILHFSLHLIAHHKEAVAVDIAVHLDAGGGVGGGGHIQVDGAHRAAVADLGGVVTAADGVAVGAGAAGAVDGLLEGHALGLIAVGVDVGNIVADYVQLAHVGTEAANGGIHCSSH